MSSYVIATLLMLACACADNNAGFSTKYDNVDLDQILANDRLLSSYVACLKNEGPCSPDGKELKKNLPKAVLDDCRRCSETQRRGSTRVMRFLIDHRPDDWTQLERIYDPEGLYKKRYLKNNVSCYLKSNVTSKEDETSNSTTEHA